MAKKPDDWKRTWRRFPSFIVVLDSPRRREAACRHFIRPCKQKPQPNTRYLAGAKSCVNKPVWSKAAGNVRYSTFADSTRTSPEVREGPCVDGSELARTFFTSAGLVGAAMCSASHDGFSVKR